MRKPASSASHDPDTRATNGVHATALTDRSCGKAGRRPHAGQYYPIKNSGFHGPAAIKLATPDGRSLAAFFHSFLARQPADGTHRFATGRFREVVATGIEYLA
jgi:hypothetical protein